MISRLAGVNRGRRAEPVAIETDRQSVLRAANKNAAGGRRHDKVVVAESPL